MEKRTIKHRVIKAILGFFATLIVLSVALVLPLRWLNPATTAFVLKDEAVASVWVYQRWANLEDISPQLQLAVIASEDQRFPRHYGFDFTELKKAWLRNGGPKRGASTLSQQLVKNLFLWKGRSLFRKGLEAYLTLYLELLLPKTRILEIYLNVVEFGPGTYGVTLAGERFFAKSARAINRVEASLLAAVLPNPKKRLVAKPSPYVYNRALDIRFAMRALGGLSYLSKLETDTKASAR